MSVQSSSPYRISPGEMVKHPNAGQAAGNSCLVLPTMPFSRVIDQEDSLAQNLFKVKMRPMS